MKGLGWRVFTVLASILFAVYLLVPSIIKFKTGKQIPKIVKAGDPWYYHVLPSEVLKLGLDLVGGLHFVLGIDFDEVYKDEAIKIKNQLKELLEREKVANVTVDNAPGNRVVVNYKSDEDWKKTDAVIAQYLGPWLDFEGQTAQQARLKMSDQHINDVKSRAVEQSLETLRNRIDEFGIAEPILQRQGEEKIMIQFPGVQDPGRLKDIIARTAKLSFHIVKSGPEVADSQPPLSQVRGWVEDFKKTKNIGNDPLNPITKHQKELNESLVGKLPAGTEIIFKKEVNVNTKEASYTPYVLDREAMVTGEDLEDARYGFDQENYPEVQFTLTAAGAGKFERATGDNVGKMMAIVLDNNVHSAPRIQSRIGGGRAVIQLAKGRPQQEVLNDAKDTSLVLRSGALPARLEFLEERIVGPSLGADSIRAGVKSLTLGLIIVLVFMALYYKTSGVIAVIALALNGLFILAVMAAFEGTLTLPGLAGMTLTLGMAIDANVLIFEHMRDELRAGKTLNYAISQGYQQAFSAIFDSNVTAIISAVVLLTFGYGPIRGFAVTLLIGLVASMFTAVFATRVIYDWYVVSKGRQEIGL